jgi:nucleoside-diphosphate-sugar epimerase
MQKNILVIGGTRYFGKLLVQSLIQAGHRVTLATRGQTPDAFGDTVQRIRVDRRDAAAMRAAFAGLAGYDLVYDQMCYSPLDAAIAASVLGGRVGRYVMASTIEVYRHLVGQQPGPFAESDWDAMQQPIDMDYPWHDPALAEASYASGKRQAEAWLYRDGSLPLVTVRIAHVLGGPEDFTGRLAHYVDLARSQTLLRHSPAAGASSFLNPQAISDFLVWVGQQDFLGPINAACDGALSAPALYQRVGEALGVAVQLQASSGPTSPDADLSPFDYGDPYTLDTGRARALGYRFDRVDDWLASLVRQHAPLAVAA